LSKNLKTEESKQKNSAIIVYYNEDKNINEIREINDATIIYDCKTKKK